jgi:hypothetical protein
MGAFCVFGVSKTLCKEKVARKLPTLHKGRELSPAEWGALRDQEAERLFAELDKPVKISPEFDAPQFCRDWLAISPSEVRMARIMARVQKKDDFGKPIMRKGQPVMTWAEYEAGERLLDKEH